MKDKIVLIISGCILMFFAVFSGCGGPAGEKEYNKAMAAWKKNDLVRAQSQLEKAIRKLSGNEKKSVAHNELGLILWKLGKTDQAIESFGESCRLVENLSGANLNLGIALYYAGQSEQAELEFTKILNEEPDNAIARFFLGLVHMQQQNWKTASQELTTGLRTTPNDAAGQNALALTELHLNRNADAAVKRLKQLLAAHPDYAPAAYNLAVIHEQWLQNPGAALGWYKQYLQKAEENGLQVAAAEQAITRLSQVGPHAPKTTDEKRNDPAAAALYIAQGTKLHASKQYREAVEQYEKAIEADPTKATAHYNLGLSHYELKQYRQTAEACSAALKLDRDSVDARYMLALSYARLGEWNNAEREANILKKADATRGESLLKYIAETRKR